MHLFVAQARLEKSACALEALHREWQDCLLSGKKTRDGSEFFAVVQGGFIARLLNKYTLRRSWGIHNQDDLRNTLDELFDGKALSQFPAWDISRGLNRVIGYGLQCRYLNVTEAHPYWQKAVVLAKKSYGSWEEYGKAVIEGRFHWSNDGQDHLFRKALKQLLTHPASPWKHVKWEELSE
jgi:hypothetical protein